MTTRVQTLRSSTTGAVPAAGTRSPGELWTNFPDLQIGVIDASKNAQKLVAVRYFSTSANYAQNDIVAQAGGIYVAQSAITAGAFNGAQWTKLAQTTDIPAVYVLPTASTSVLGGVMVDGVTVKINSGVISSAGLVAVATSPPASPQNGSLWFDLTGGQLYAYVNDGTSSQWVVAVNQSISGVYLPMNGGVLTGPLTLAGDPVNPLDAATKQYVDAKPPPINDSRIINGDMRIDQRNNGASGTASAAGTYTVDRWSYTASQASKLTWQRQAGAGIANGNFQYCMSLISSSAFTPAAGDNFQYRTALEGDAISDFAWGTAQAQPVTLSFWATTNTAGTYSGSIRDYAATRSYPFTFALAASVWTKFAITIPGDTSGSWVLNGNGGGLYLTFDLGSGATFRAPANAWAAGNFTGATGAANIVATNGAGLYLTGVKLEAGSVATSFNRQSLAKSLADCQRYYQQLGGATAFLLQFYANAAGWTSGIAVGFQTMRGVPTAARIGNWTITNLSAGPNLYPGTGVIGFNATSNAIGQCSVYSADTTGMITLNAEL